MVAERAAGDRGQSEPKGAHVKVRNPFSGLFSAPRGEDSLARYVVREYRRGRTLADVLDDPYVRNRSTPEQRARLFERPEVVRAVGDETAATFAQLTAADLGRAPTASGGD